MNIQLENLAIPAPDEKQGCGKPDCGKTLGGGCTDCGSGGCSTCSHETPDLRPYFAHLREKMETKRVSLIE